MAGVRVCIVPLGYRPGERQGGCGRGADTDTPCRVPGSTEGGRPRARRPPPRLPRAVPCGSPGEGRLGCPSRRCRNRPPGGSVRPRTAPRASRAPPLSGECLRPEPRRPRLRKGPRYLPVAGALGGELSPARGRVRVNALPAVAFLVLRSPIWKMPVSYVRVSGVCNRQTPKSSGLRHNKLVSLSKHSRVGVRMGWWLCSEWSVGTSAD